MPTLETEAAPLDAGFPEHWFGGPNDELHVFRTDTGHRYYLVSFDDPKKRRRITRKSAARWYFEYHVPEIFDGFIGWIAPSRN